MSKKYNNISVTAFILWKGKALLVQRSATDDFLAGYWEQVGGKVEVSENQIDAVIREVQEEVGLLVKPLRAYHQYDYIHNGGLTCEVAYLCELPQEPNILLSPEHQNFIWITEEELDNLKFVTDNMRTVIKEGFTANSKI